MALPGISLYVMISRKKTTLFLDVNEETTVLELKLMIHGILKVSPDEQRLYYGNAELKDEQILADVGLNKGKAGAHCPASLGLAIRGEELDITPLSSPPPYPDAIKEQDATTEIVGDADWVC